MRNKLIWFLKNDVVFWIFFIFLTIITAFFVLKKEGIKITISLGEPYENKVIEVFGE